MSDKEPLDVRNPDCLTLSEIDRYANYESDSDKYSSGDSYKPSGNETSDSDEPDDGLENSVSICNALSCLPDIDVPGPSGLQSMDNPTPPLSPPTTTTGNNTREKTSPC
ncbi:hypothetical protein J6590_096212 [Homalodisca vitripennis]|nr:hypothetical protein J6590_096212 [Homalodisca vitripennis]